MEQDIKERLIRLEVLQEKDIQEATDWRKIFCVKLDKLFDLVNTLPCDTREGRWASLLAQIKWLWVVFVFIIGLEGVFVASLLYHLGK